MPSKQYFFLEDESAGAGPAGAGAVYDPHGVYPSPRIKSQSFHELNLELEQNQPRYLYFKSDISIYYSLLIKDAELLTVDTSIPTSNLTERSGGNNDRDAMESEVMLQRFASTNAEEMEENSVPIHEEDRTSLPLSPSTIPSRYQSPQPSVDHTSEIFAKHIKILKYIQSSAWSLHEGDSQWAPNDCAWYCRTCYSPFSLFQRKHHCRRCGEVFCDDHAPKVDILTCLPSEFRDVWNSLTHLLNPHHH